jgi:hypothetical protein
MPEKRYAEVSEYTIMEIRKLSTNDAVEAVKSFRSKKRYTVVGTKGKDFKLKATIENIQNSTQFVTEALLDSGATGSCVNRDFVKKHNLHVRKLPIKMPVYNADGTMNADGSIEGFTEVQMIIGDHAERIELAVTNLGNIDIFLGLDWLRFHNPSIDWPTSEVLFDKCPHKCGYIPWWISPEDEEHNNRLRHDE